MAKLVARKSLALKRGPRSAVALGRLQPMPTPWPGLNQPARVKRPASMPRGYQHSLRVYEELIMTEVG